MTLRLWPGAQRVQTARRERSSVKRQILPAKMLFCPTVDIFKHLGIAEAAGRPGPGSRRGRPGLRREGRRAAACAPPPAKTGTGEKQSSHHWTLCSGALSHLLFIPNLPDRHFLFLFLNREDGRPENIS